MTVPRHRIAALAAVLAMVGAGASLLDAAAQSPRGAAVSAAVSAKALFVADCGSCHRLRAARTRGTAGPSLDRAFRRTTRTRIRRKVLRAITRGDGAMPAGILTGANAKRVAAYVARVSRRR